MIQAWLGNSNTAGEWIEGGFVSARIIWESFKNRPGEGEPAWQKRAWIEGSPRLPSQGDYLLRLAALRPRGSETFLVAAVGALRLDVALFRTVLALLLARAPLWVLGFVCLIIFNLLVIYDLSMFQDS